MAKLHWADQMAQDLIQARPDQARFVVASGITPSGEVHVGNFREVITVDLVARALRARGKQVRFIFSWDDFDVFRKVPGDIPEQAKFAPHLRKSVVDVPDPAGQAESYAGHFVARFEAELADVGIAPEFIRQSVRYRAGVYAEGIAQALEQSAVIREALNRHRTTPLPEDWLPLSGFCDRCLRDDLELSVAAPGRVRYRCRLCGHEAEVELAQGGRIKLPWRVDWPMRWAHEQVDFEPGGKDHSTAGGSYDTGKEIARRVYGTQAPRYLGYEFVRAKGQGGKLSSSKGGVITVADCLEVYQPEILRWLFTKFTPRTSFQISFDYDVIQNYEEFDRALLRARKTPPGPGPQSVARRGIELACLDEEAALLSSDFVPPPFRGITTVLQAFDGDREQTLEHFLSDAASELERRWVERRVHCAWRWIELYAPEEFRFLVRAEPVARTLTPLQRVAVEGLVKTLRDDPSEAAIVATLRGLAQLPDMDVRHFFPVAYDLLIAKDKGPKLSTLLASLDAERTLALLEPSLAANPVAGASPVSSTGNEP